MPLNTYVSYDMPAGGDEDSDMRLVDILQSQTELNPEKLLIDKEHNRDLKSRLKEVLSTLNSRCWLIIWKEWTIQQLQKNAEAAEVS